MASRGAPEARSRSMVVVWPASFSETMAASASEVLLEPECPPQLVDVEALLERPRSLGVLDLGE